MTCLIVQCSPCWCVGLPRCLCMKNVPIRGWLMELCPVPDLYSLPVSTPHTHTNALTHASTHMHARAHTHIHAYTHAHTYTHAPTHTLTHTHTHTHTHSLCKPHCVLHGFFSSIIRPVWNLRLPFGSTYLISSLLLLPIYSPLALSVLSSFC